MNEIIREHSLRMLTVQRNISLAIVFMLLFLSLLLGVLLFTKTEKVIVVPAIVEKEFWVDGSSMSPTYLEQMGCFIGDLLLTRSPMNADVQLTILMRHVDPSFSSVLGSKLAKELSKLQKDNASYVFFRTNLCVEPETQSVLINGERALFLGEKMLSKTKESYRLRFKNNSGRLLLSSVEKGDDV